MTSDSNSGPERFEAEIELLRDARPTLSPHELDNVYQRVRRRSKAPRRSWFLRSRAALSVMIAIGALLTGGSTAIGLSGSAMSGNASQAQYGPTTPTTHTSIGPSTSTTPAAQQAAQQAAPSGQLPFTGYVIFPVLALGLVLLGAGLVGRRLSHRRE